MVQDNLEMHQNWKSLNEILKTMLEEYEHSFFISDLNLLSKTYLGGRNTAQRKFYGF
jgi:hypothetical protein